MSARRASARALRHTMLLALALGCLLLLPSVASAATGSISGHVTPPGGGDADHVCVFATSYNNAGFGGLAMTAPDGTYTVAGLAPGTYRVQFSTANCGGSTANYITQYYNGTTNFSAAAQVSVGDGHDTPGINATMQAAGTIEGQVSGPATGTGDNVCVQATNASPTGASTNGFATTHTNGTYSITGLAPGNYIVRFSTNNCFGATHNYVSQFYDGAADSSSADEVTVTAGAASGGVDAAMEAAGSIHGHVSPPGGSGNAANVCVWAESDDSSIVEIATTGSDGAYTVNGLKTGSYTVQFYTNGCFASSSANYLTQYYNGAFDPADADAVAVTAPDQTNSIDATMAAAKSITGHVALQGAGNAIGVCVQVQNKTGEPSFFTNGVTNSSGDYNVGGLTPGRHYVVRFQADHCGGAPAGYQSEYYDNVATYQEATPVLADSGGINATLARTPSNNGGGTPHTPSRPTHTSAPSSTQSTTITQETAAPPVFTAGAHSASASLKGVFNAGTAACGAGPCSVTATATIKGLLAKKVVVAKKKKATVVGKVHLTVAGGKTAAIKVKLTKKALKALRKKKRLKVSVKIVITDASGAKVAKTVTVTVKAPKKKKK
jgi:hypothetical protein